MYEARGIQGSANFDSSLLDQHCVPMSMAVMFQSKKYIVLYAVTSV